MRTHSDIPNGRGPSYLLLIVRAVTASELTTGFGPLKAGFKKGQKASKCAKQTSVAYCRGPAERRAAEHWGVVVTEEGVLLLLLVQ
jgi:hypothetical protein